MVRQALDTLLASHTAPTLLGAKPANLVSLPCFKAFSQMVQNYNAHLNPQDIYFYPVCRCSCKQLLLVYRKTKLQNTLCDPQKRAFLLSRGYPVYHKHNVRAHLDKVLACLARRISPAQDFPHEIGIFLGYPLEDVTGFIANNGCNYKYSGCWKVYGDEARSRRLFAQYKSCKQQLSKALETANGNLLHCLCENKTIENRRI